MSFGVSGPKRLSGQILNIWEGRKRKGKWRREAADGGENRDTACRYLTEQNVSAPSTMNHKSELFCSCCPMKSGSAPSRMGAGDYRVLNGHFSSVNNRLQEIPIHDSCPVYGCGWVCGDPSPWNATKARRWQSNGRMQPADTDNGDLCRESLLSPLPVSCLRTWGEIPADCFQLPSWFHWAAKLLWSGLRPERLISIPTVILQAGEPMLLHQAILLQAAEYAVHYHMLSKKPTQRAKKAELRNLQEMKVYRCTQLLYRPLRLINQRVVNTPLTLCRYSKPTDSHPLIKISHHLTQSSVHSAVPHSKYRVQSTVWRGEPGRSFYQ